MKSPREALNNSVKKETEALRKSAGDLTNLTSESLRISSDMDKTILSLVSRAINHVISVSDIYKQAEQIMMHIAKLDSRLAAMDISGEIRVQAKKITVSSLFILSGLKDVEAETAEMSKSINDLIGGIEDLTGTAQHIAQAFAHTMEHVSRIQETVFKNEVS